MKYIILIPDGMAGRRLKELGNKTCLQTARTPNMDTLASEGEVGRVRTIPDGFEPGSDVANLSILGYDPSKYYSGRAPLEAEYMGVKLGVNDVAFRCNLVTLDFQNNKDNAVMKDYSAGHITTKEAGQIIRFIDKRMGNKEFAFHPGISYRHLLVWKNGQEKIRCTPPHDITGKKIRGHLPEGRGADKLLALMHRSWEVLASSPVNQKRIYKGMNPANSVWFWGQGRKSGMPKFKDKYNLKGALISAVDLLKGMGMTAGFEIINVKGATGYIDTNYTGKANAALRTLKTHDIVYVHVEAPDEAGHNGDIGNKIRAIEDFDEKVLGTIMKGLRRFDEYSILLLPDHATPIRLKTHSEEPVPFLIYRNGNTSKKRSIAFSENIYRMKNVPVFEKGYKLMDYFINPNSTIVQKCHSSKR